MPANPVPVSQTVGMKTNEGGSILSSHGYTLGEIIGRGSFSVVRIASSKKHKNLQVAVKIISKKQSSIQFLSKFLPREIGVVKGLKHPSIIKYYVALETTHRDIKCENILFASESILKLSDFGFAKAKKDQHHLEFPISTTYCGSYAYACPEILQGIPYKPDSSDIWSMGVVLFATAFTQLPFDDSAYKDLKKKQMRKPQFPRKPARSKELRALILNILKPQSTRASMISVKQDPWLNAKTTTESVPQKVVRFKEFIMGSFRSLANKKISNEKRRDDTDIETYNVDETNGKNDGKDHETKILAVLSNTKDVKSSIGVKIHASETGIYVKKNQNEIHRIKSNHSIAGSSNF